MGSVYEALYMVRYGTYVCYGLQVHPWHVSDTLMYREGYHDRFPETLYTWRELEVFTKYKYITWPAYYVFPVCNIYDPTKSERYNILFAKPEYHDTVSELFS